MKSSLITGVPSLVICCVLMLGQTGCEQKPTPGAGSSQGAGSQPSGAGGAPTAKSGDQDPARKGQSLVQSKNCTSVCHKLNNPLNAPTLEATIAPRREKLAKYAELIEKLKGGDAALFEKSRSDLEAILAEKDSKAQQRRWYQSYLHNTKFDDPKNKMMNTNPPLTAEEIDALAAYLAQLP